MIMTIAQTNSKKQILKCKKPFQIGIENSPAITIKIEKSMNVRVEKSHIFG